MKKLNGLIWECLGPFLSPEYKKEKNESGKEGGETSRKISGSDVKGI